MAADLRLVLGLLIVLSAIRSSSADAIFIENTCKQTQTPDKCVALLESVKWSFNVTTVFGLTEIAVDLTKQKTAQVFSLVSTLRDQHSGEPIEEPLGQCAEQYSNAVDNMQDAADNLGSHSYAEAAKSVEDAMTAPDSCEAAFGQGLKSPVTQEDQTVSTDMNVAYDLLDLLSS
ncbi:hypothetical protein QJS10_CPA02g01338 [Acorus calamus]|uniref:Pectinesterase inhibitor domain-containing protein n=1 Tax=Acorus calamus TaxID=4465 RepID=A0AAV9FD71_ACOCL|nr:hypothetical protein QJS10_CPA02g01338 [Acorus calamus]